MSFNNLSIEDISQIINPDSHEFVGFPSFIRTGKDYFLLYDSRRSVHKFDYEGNHVFSFGKEGRGPGEFQAITNYWIRNDYFELYDYNGSKLLYFDLNCDFLYEKEIESRFHSVEVEKTENNLFIVPSNGENNSLLKIVDAEKENKIFFAGEVEYDEDHLSTERIRQIVNAGNLPNEMYHKIFIGYNDTGIFSYQRATANLQKFDMTGDLLWEKKIILPEQEILFEKFKQELFGQDRYIPELSYARGVHVTKEGIAIMLNVPVGNSVKVLWVDNLGENIHIVEYPSLIRNESFFLLRFRLAPEIGYILFTNSREGVVFKSKWPL